MPEISVVMSNYNTPEEYLRKSIDSILNQTFKDFEFLIVDDGSKDDSICVIESYKDDRIVLIKNEQNLGLPASLNKAFAAAKGKYIARMDSDDISFPERFEKQIRWLDAHPEYIVCGSWIKKFGEQDTESCYLAGTRSEFRVNMLFENYPSIAHPTAMFRKSLLDEFDLHYNEEYFCAQDYKMWVDCSKYAPCAIYPEILLNYRVHKNSISTKKLGMQESFVRKNIETQLSELGITVNDDEYKIHRSMLRRSEPYNKEVKKWIIRLIKANKEKNIYNQKQLKKMLRYNWLKRSKRAFIQEKNVFKKTKIIINSIIL